MKAAVSKYMVLCVQCIICFLLYSIHVEQPALSSSEALDEDNTTDGRSRLTTTAVLCIDWF